MQALAAGVRVSCLPKVIFHVEDIIIPARNLMRGQPGAIFNSLSEMQGEERPKGTFKTREEGASALGAPFS